MYKYVQLHYKYFIYLTDFINRSEYVIKNLTIVNSSVFIKTL